MGGDIILLSLLDAVSLLLNIQYCLHFLLFAGVSFQSGILKGNLFLCTGRNLF